MRSRDSSTSAGTSRRAAALFCGTLQDVTVPLGSSGENVYQCNRCRFTTFSDDEMNQHGCVPKGRLRRWGAAVAEQLPRLPWP